MGKREALQFFEAADAVDLLQTAVLQVKGDEGS